MSRVRYAILGIFTPFVCGCRPGEEEMAALLGQARQAFTDSEYPYLTDGEGGGGGPSSDRGLGKWLTCLGGLG